MNAPTSPQLGTGPRSPGEWAQENREGAGSGPRASHRKGSDEGIRIRRREPRGACRRRRASAATLDDVKARGTLRCGVNTGPARLRRERCQRRLAGPRRRLLQGRRRRRASATPRRCSTCRSRRAALPALQNNEVDLLARNTTWTYEPRHRARARFCRHQLLRRPGLHGEEGVEHQLRAPGLAGATVCVQSGTTTELNLADYFAANNISSTRCRRRRAENAPTVPMTRPLRRLTTDQSGLYASAPRTRHAGRPRRPARDHLQGAARTGRAPRRRRSGSTSSSGRTSRSSTPRSSASPRPTSKR